MIPTRDEMETMLRCPAWTLGDQHLALSWMKSMRDEIDRLTAELAGDGKALRELRAWIIDEKWCAPGIVRKIDEMLARPCPEVPETPKIQPSEDREAKIEAWEMHSAGDGKALRELREWILEMWWVASQGKWETGAHTAGKVVGRIDEMLARPAPSHVYSRGRTIAESAEPPTAYYPPAPVDKPAATPDDERRAMIGMARQFRETYYPHSAVMHASGDDGQELLIYTRGEYRNDLVRLIASFGNMTGSAPVEKPAPDHFPDAGKMVPVLYWLEDGKFARAMLVGKDLLVVDLTFGDGPSVVGKPEWFEAGYVAAYGGLVPESATRGKEPGQWDYGVASIAKPAAAVPDDIGLGPVTDEMVQSGIAAVKDGRWITLEQLRKELAPVPDDTRELVAQLADLVAWAMPTMNHHKGVKAIAAKLRGGA